VSDERPIPFEDNWRCQLLLQALESGPKSTLDLQKHWPLVHVARQVWELRHWYGYRIKTGRLKNRVAVYELVARPVPVTRGVQESLTL
jgi:hypothetical protein